MLEVAVRRRLPDFMLDAAFTVPDRGVTALFGRSGAGKTTLVDAIAGLVRPDEGMIRLGETVFFDSRRGIDLPPERRRIGYVFQDARLFPHMTVRANLTYGFRRVPANERRIAVDPVVAMLGLGHLLDRRPHTLSGGERQRVALGRALLAQPRLLLMDEPLASLDQARKAEILPYIERLRDEMDLPVVLVSHAMDEVVRLASTLVLVDGGRIAACGPLPEVMTRLDLAPLTGLHDAGAVIDVTVHGHDDRDDVTLLAFVGGILRVPRLNAAVGQRLRLRVHARDVILAVGEPYGLSVSNALDGRVAELGGSGPVRDVRLDVGGTALIARVTRASAERLGLVPGLPVKALVKAVAFDREGLEFTAPLGRDGILPLP